MEIKTTNRENMGRFKGRVTNPWPELASALARLGHGEALILKGTEWKEKYQNSKKPLEAVKQRVRSMAKEQNKEVVILRDPNNDDLSVEIAG